MVIAPKNQRVKWIVGAGALLVVWVVVCFFGMRALARRLDVPPPSHSRINEPPPALQPITRSNVDNLELVAAWGVPSELAMYSPDGKWLAFQSGQYLRLHDAETLEFAHYLSFAPSAFISPSFSWEPTWSADGAMVAVVSGNDTVLVYRLVDGKILHTLAAQDEITALAFSPDSSLLAVGGNKRTGFFETETPRTIQLWRVADGTLAQTLERGNHWRYITGVAFNPDGTLLAAGMSRVNDSDGEPMHLWRVSDGQKLPSFQTSGHVGTFTPLPRWNRLGTLLIGSSLANDDQHAIWRAGEVEPLELLEGYAALHPSGDYFFQLNGSTLRVWSLVGDTPLVAYEQTIPPATQLSFNGDGSRFVLSGEEGVEFWQFGPDGLMRLSAQDEALQEPSILTMMEVSQPVLHPTRDEFVGYHSPLGGYGVWDIASATPRHVPLGHSRSPLAIAYSPDGRWVASGSEDGWALLWDYATGRERQRLDHGRAVEVHDVAFSPAGALLATIDSESQLSLWQVESGQLLKTFGTPAPFAEHSFRTNNLYQIAFSPDGRWLASNTPQGTQLWAMPDGTLAHTFEGGGPAGLAFHPDGSLLAAGQPDGAVHIWNLADHTQLVSIRADLSSHPTPSLAFSGDGSYLAAGFSHGEGKSHVWGTQGWNLVRSFNIALGRSSEEWLLEQEWTEIAWHPTEPLLVVGEYGGAIAWDVSSGRRLATIPIGPQDTYLSQARTMAWSPKGDGIAYGIRHYSDWHPFVEILGVRAP